MTVGPGHLGRRPRGRVRRLVALLLVAAAVAGGGVLARVAARRAPATALQPAALAAQAAPVASTSSAWYCPGGPGEDAGTTHLLLANAAGRAVRVEVSVVDASDSRDTETLRIGPHGESDVVPGALVHGAWLASRIVVTGGAVSATELVDGPSGRALATCASEVSSKWYFAAGSTRGGSTLNVALFDPTPNLAVVDLSFVTASGFTAPSRFQGVVVQPWTMRVLTVGTYIQNQGTVATVVAARSGAVVADELQLYGPGGRGGVALSLGVPRVSARWNLPSVEDQQGGASELSVFNPTTKSEQVVVTARLPAGPVEPFSEVLAPNSVWTVTTSQQPRIAIQVPYTLRVRVLGPGVVVAEAGAGGPLAPSTVRPWESDIAVSSIQTSAARRWLVPAIPSATSSVSSVSTVSSVSSVSTAGLTAQVAGSTTASPELVAENPGHRRVRAEVTWWSASGERHVRRFKVQAFARVALIAPSGLVVVHSDGPLALMGDQVPAGVAGVVGIPAVPLSP